MNFSAKHESHCLSGFYKVILLCHWNHFPTSIICLLFLMEKVKAQGGGQTPDVVAHALSTKFTLCTWTVSQLWHVTGKENGSIPGNPSVLCLPYVYGFIFSSHCRIINYIDYILAVCKTYHLVLGLWWYKKYVLLPSPALESGWVDKTCF